MWRTLVRLALFQAGPEAPRSRISPNDANPVLTWIRCHLLTAHDRVIRSAPAMCTSNASTAAREAAAGSQPRAGPRCRCAWSRTPSLSALQTRDRQPPASHRPRPCLCGPDGARRAGAVAPAGPCVPRDPPAGRGARSSAADGRARRPGARRSRPRPPVRLARPAPRAAPVTARAPVIPTRTFFPRTTVDRGSSCHPPRTGRKSIHP